MALFGGLLLLALMLATVSLFGFTLSLAYHLAAGLVVGALARLVLPGEEKIGLLGTSLIGMAGSMGGALIGQLLHVGSLLQLGLGVGVAALLLTALGFRARG